MRVYWEGCRAGDVIGDSISLEFGVVSFDRGEHITGCDGDRGERDIGLVKLDDFISESTVAANLSCTFEHFLIFLDEVEDGEVESTDDFFNSSSVG